jgi:hypothetical protein
LKNWPRRCPELGKAIKQLVGFKVGVKIALFLEFKLRWKMQSWLYVMDGAKKTRLPLFRRSIYKLLIRLIYFVRKACAEKHFKSVFVN